MIAYPRPMIKLVLSFSTAIQQDPQQNIPWQEFNFITHLPWMGIPDGFVDCYQRINCDVLFSLGWLPSEFARPPLRQLDGPLTPDDEEIDWGSAAVAYEYYFAVIHHFAQTRWHPLPDV